MGELTWLAATVLFMVICRYLMAARSSQIAVEPAQSHSFPSVRLSFDREMLAAPSQATFLVATTAMVGAAVTFSPMLGAAIGGLALGLGFLTLGQRIVPLFLVAMCLGLGGYMFFGRGFAYAGIPPLFVSEALLGLALLALAYTFSLRQFTALHVLLVLFVAWGLLRTAPFVGTYGIDALRDAVVWGYAIFALAAANVVSLKFFQRIGNGLASVLPIFLLWVPVLAVLDLAGVIPRWPQSGIPVAIFKPGDMAVHLAGMAALVISGMYASSGARRLPPSVFWTLVIVAFTFVAATNRAGFLTVSLAISAAFLLWPSRQFFSFSAVAMIIIVVFTVVNPSLKFAGVSREIGPDQIVRNVASIVSSSETGGEAGLQDTKNWRQRWWEKVWGYTVHGPYFFDGKGYGINLSNADGFQTLSDGSSRSPHSGHITILARSGVPGLALWLLIQVWFGVAMCRTLLRARRMASHFWAQMDTWILIYWLAMLVNLSFEVYIEGPQGGIWFWTMIGLGMGAMRLQGQQLNDHPLHADQKEGAKSNRASWNAPADLSRP